jgi:hypothetical protein
MKRCFISNRICVCQHAVYQHFELCKIFESLFKIQVEMMEILGCQSV